MSDHAFTETVHAICARDTRYDPEAYFFVRDALDYATKALKKPRQGRGRHISGGELLDAIRTYTVREFGPMAHTVLRTWGVQRTEDVGEIVFNLVEAGTLGKTDEDTRADFAGVFSFEEAFVQPFLPRGASTPAAQAETAEGGI